MRRGKVGTFEVRHYRLRYFHRQTPSLLLLITSHFPPILVRQKMGLTWDLLGTHLPLCADRNESPFPNFFPSAKLLLFPHTTNSCSAFRTSMFQILAKVKTTRPSDITFKHPRGNQGNRGNRSRQSPKVTPVTPVTPRVYIFAKSNIYRRLIIFTLLKPVGGIENRLNN